MSNARGARYKRFYVSLALVNILLYNCAIVAFGAVACWALYRTETMRFFDRYDEALIALAGAYDAKHRNFPHILSPFFEDIQSRETLNQFLNDGSDTAIYTNPLLAQKMVALLKRVADRDRDVRAVYLYKRNTGAMYAYTAPSMFRKLAPPYPYAEMMTRTSGRRIVTGAQHIPVSELHHLSSVRAFGIVGSLIGIDGGEQATEVLVAYGMDSLGDIVGSGMFGVAGARFGIATTRGDLIFDSEQAYAPDGYTRLECIGQLLAEDTDTLTLDGVKYYKKTIVHPTRGYVVFYYLPRSSISVALRNAGLPVVALVACFCCASAVIFIVSIRLSGKRVRQLEHGMRQIGARNFSYRIPVGRQNDELTLVASSFNGMCDQLQQTINAVYLYNIRQKEARFYSLQTSINPHFLYNTLEAVRARLSDTGSVEASEMIVMLSRLFEYQVKGETFVTIDEELEALRLYAHFFELRYDGQFRFDIRVEPEILDYAMPKYTLQPILENYFIHGMRQGPDNRVVLSGSMRGRDILIVVEDNGLGIDEEKLAEMNRRLRRLADDRLTLGLMNVHQRLRYTFGTDYGIDSVESGGAGRGARVTLRMRAARPGEMEEATRPPDTP